MGYGVSVGLEDNLWYDKEKTLPSTNKSLMKRVHSLNEMHQRDWKPHSESRFLWFYNQKGKIYW